MSYWKTTATCRIRSVWRFDFRGGRPVHGHDVHGGSIGWIVTNGEFVASVWPGVVAATRQIRGALNREVRVSETHWGNYSVASGEHVVNQKQAASKPVDILTVVISWPRFHLIATREGPRGAAAGLYSDLHVQDARLR